ncbi:hypothetical protein BDR26DRAFT_914208 [Obelidium mucronatum]|nr:hypothetical protein BDR26DRAFT_914208 [Obelidium mucronatum]
MSLFDFGGAAPADAALDSLFVERKTTEQLSATPAKKRKAALESGHSEAKKTKKDEKADDDADADEEAPKKKKIPSKEDAEKNARSVFVGNLPVAATEKATSKKLLALFKEHGSVESIRFRSIAFLNNVPRKVSYMTKEFHPNRDSLNAYIVYKSKDSVEKALTLNGTLFEGKHIRVDKAQKPVRKQISEKGLDMFSLQKSKVLKWHLKMDGQKLAGREVRITKCSKSQILRRHAGKGKPNDKNADKKRKPTFNGKNQDAIKKTAQHVSTSNGVDKAIAAASAAISAKKPVSADKKGHICNEDERQKGV